MTIKLNLTIEENIAKEIKRYARTQKTSVSKIVQEQFTHLLDKKASKKGKRTFVEKYAGTIRDLRIDDIDKARDEYLKQKYGL